MHKLSAFGLPPAAWPHRVREKKPRKLGDACLHSAEDSWDKVNFNSAAVSTNMTLLINGDLYMI